MEEIKAHTHKWYTFGCKDATYLTVKKDYAAITRSEKILLGFHILICKYCRYFAIQNSKINKLFKASYNNANLTLPTNKKDALNQVITQNLKK